jgi:beta-lactam-binding protein with PASTA domain
VGVHHQRHRKRESHMQVKFLILAVAAASILVTGCGTASPSAAAPEASVTTSAAPSMVTLPDVVGQNGAIARDTLTTLGLTKLDLAADATSGHQIVLNPANWTVTKMEPKAGTQVRTNQTVVITMTK